MKRLFFPFVCVVLLVTLRLSAEDAALVPLSVRKASSLAVPSLDELAADWMDAKTLCNRPAVHNFWGGLKTTGNLMAFEIPDLSAVFPGRLVRRGHGGRHACRRGAITLVPAPSHATSGPGRRDTGIEHSPAI